MYCVDLKLTGICKQKRTETLGDEANANIFGTTLLSASLNHSRKESVCGTY